MTNPPATEERRSAPSTRPAPSEPGRIARLLAARRNYREEVLAMTASSRFVVFYGCGIFFESLIPTWEAFVGKRIDFCCDSNPNKWGKLVCGIKCLSPAELEAIKEECVVFVTVGEFLPVLSFLAEKQIPSVHLIYKYDLVSSDFLSRLDLAATGERITAVRALLADARSVQVFDAIINRVLDSGCPVGVMGEVFEGEQYFPADIIRLSPDEAFVDAGAFTGDTAQEFVKRTEGRFSALHCFELDSANCQSLQTTIAALPGRDRIFLHPEGLSDTNADIPYSSEKAQSAIGTGEAMGRVVRLDDAIGKARVTFLKMDIEGAELRALEGARETILANKPKLAICVYHHFKDLWEIPLFIKSLVPEYRIFLRHHTKLEYETVCYALPPAEDVP